jgi:hypothetical protein
VICPPHLVRQWCEEIEKSTSPTLNVVVILSKKAILDQLPNIFTAGMPLALSFPSPSLSSLSSLSPSPPSIKLQLDVVIVPKALVLDVDLDPKLLENFWRQYTSVSVDACVYLFIYLFIYKYFFKFFI